MNKVNDPSPQKPESAPPLEQSLQRLRARLSQRDAKARLQQPTKRAGAQSRFGESPESEQPICGAEEFCISTLASGVSAFSLCDRCNPRLSCSVCGGSGRSTRLNPETLQEEVDPQGCACTQKEQRVRRLNEAGLPQRYLDATLTLPPALHSKPEHLRNYQRVLGACQHFAEASEESLLRGEVPGQAFFLLLCGSVGAGKTHAAAAILKHIILKTGSTGRFIEFQQLLFELRNCYSKGRSEEELLAPLRRCDVLVIDELGKARSENEWQMERLDDLVNARYNSGRITLFTTNFSPLNEQPENALSHGLRNPPASEGFWSQSLADRVGLRIYDRIMEVAQVVSFHSLPSLRRLTAQRIRESAVLSSDS